MVTPLPVPAESDASRILYMDRDLEGGAEFREALSHHGVVVTCHDLHSVLDLLLENPGAMALLDTSTLLESPTSQVRRLVDFRSKNPLALATDRNLEDYFHGIREWGILQSIVKTPPVDSWEVGHFLRIVRNPLSGFGLMSWLASTVQMFSLAIRTIPEKVAAIERVTNHFATCGFGVHELYNVRLILEEIINNALFHAFRDEDGGEKYSIAEFESLGEGETVRIEYGSDSSVVGFSVTDNAGTLPVSVILDKLERQLHHDGVFDESGRGLHLSRLLASRLAFNVETNRRTQLVAVFGTRDRPDRARPLMINQVGEDRFGDWRRDADFD